MLTILKLHLLIKRNLVRGITSTTTLNTLTLFAVGARVARLTDALARHAVTLQRVDAHALTLAVDAPLPVGTRLLTVRAHLACACARAVECNTDKTRD